MDIVDRLFELVDKKFNEQQEFAALLGVDPTLPSRWRNRKSTSYQRRLPQIAEALGTTTEYLLTGNGPKKKTAPAKRSESDAISDDDIKAAFFEGAEDLTKEEMDALWADARDYMRYKLEQRRKQQLFRRRQKRQYFRYDCNNDEYRGRKPGQRRRERFMVVVLR